MLGLNKEKTLIVHLGCRSTWFIMNVLFCLKFLSSAFVWSHLKKKNNNNFEFVLLKKNKRNEQKTLEINTLSNNFPFCLFLITFKSSKLFNFPWKHTWVSFFPVFCFAALSLALILVSGSTLSRIKNNRISFMCCSFCSHANRICACVCVCLCVLQRGTKWTYHVCANAQASASFFLLVTIRRSLRLLSDLV